jgi:hypothetical protein
MKTFLIAILTLALLAAAFMTRPGRREFMLYLLDQHVSPAGSWTAADIDKADNTAKGVTFRNRVLWTSVEKDGKAVCTGVFGHWFPHGDGVEARVPSAAELANLAKTARAQVQ